MKKNITSLQIKIKRLRLEKGISQTKVASKLGISQNAYSKIELGYSGIKIDKLYKIADVLDTTVKELLD
jgi:transcriptional regulator with XRE-family HTH domain